LRLTSGGMNKSLHPITSMFDDMGQVDSDPHQIPHRSQSSCGDGKVKEDAAIHKSHSMKSKPQRRRMMTLDEVRRKVNEQILADMDKDSPWNTASSSSSKTEFDSVLCGSVSSFSIQNEAPEGPFFESSSEKKNRARKWSLKLPNFRKWRVHPSFIAPKSA